MTAHGTEPTGFETLWAEAAAIWEECQNEPAFEGYVSADYLAVYHSLKKYQNRGLTFLEWGSGLGVATIMADQMGFDAYGIEIEPELVEHACCLADRFDSKAKFACGSFIPSEYEESSKDGEEFHRTVCDAAAAYDDFDRELRDFDIVYAYPWPDEHLVFRSIVRRCGAPHALLICFDAREGIKTIKFGKQRA